MTDDRPLLPEQTQDDLEDWADRRAGAGDDPADEDVARLLRERPPHYDR